MEGVCSWPSSGGHVPSCFLVGILCLEGHVVLGKALLPAQSSFEADFPGSRTFCGADLILSNDFSDK